MKQKIPFIYFISLTLFVLPLNAQIEDQLDDYFSSLEARNEAMGSIAVLKEGKIIYQRAIGAQTLEGPAPVKATPQTSYRIWSITKTYIATAVLKAVDQGLLTLDTRLSEFFPSINRAEQITIQQMLQHRSGIHDYTQHPTPDPQPHNLQGPEAKNALVNTIASFEPDFPPGTAFRYSNSNYVLLGYILEKQTQQPLPAILSTYILQPSGLTDTYFGTGQPTKAKGEAMAYDWRNRSWQPITEANLTPSEPAGAGGIMATASDVARFYHSLFQGDPSSGPSFRSHENLD